MENYQSSVSYSPEPVKGGIGDSPMYSEEEKKDIVTRLASDIVKKEREVQEEELKTDKNWIDASKIVYELENGYKFEGDDEAAARMGLDMMAEFNYNLSLGAIPIAAKFTDATDIQKIAGRYLFDTFDKKDVTMDGTIRFFKEIGQDPTTYLGLGTGIGIIGRQAAKTAAMAGIKKATALNMSKFLSKPSTVAAIEGATYGGIDDATRQYIDIKTKAKDEYSPLQTGIASTVGVAAGVALGKGGEYIGEKLGKFASDPKEKIKKGDSSGK